MPHDPKSAMDLPVKLWMGVIVLFGMTLAVLIIDIIIKWFE